MRDLARRRHDLQTYDPLDVFEEMRRSFESFFDLPASGRHGQPAVDIRQEEDRYVLEADIPGLTEKDIDIQIDRDVLTFSSRREEKKEERMEGYLVQERRRSRFQRSFVLPSDVDRERIEAHFRDGMLVIDLPRTEKTKPRQIPVKKG